MMILAVVGLSAYTQLDLLAPVRPSTFTGWVWVGLVLFAALAAIGALRYQNEIDDLRARPRPRLLVRDFWTNPVYLNNKNPPTREDGWLTSVQFVNSPTANSSEATAHNVTAHLSFYELDQSTPHLITQLKGPILGAWTDPEQPDTKQFAATTSRKGAKVDFEVAGIPWNLDLVIKPGLRHDADVPECYAVSNRHPNGATLNHVLGSEPFTARIELKGDAISDVWWFKILPNGGTYTGIEITSGARHELCRTRFPSS